MDRIKQKKKEENSTYHKQKTMWLPLIMNDQPLVLNINE